MQQAVLDRRIDMRRNPYYWIGFKRVRSDPRSGTDLCAIYEKRISVTPLHLNLTDFKVIQRLKGVIEPVLPKKPGKPSDESVLLPQDDAARTKR
jgi:5'-nucleotidase